MYIKKTFETFESREKMFKNQKRPMPAKLKPKIDKEDVEKNMDHITLFEEYASVPEFKKQFEDNWKMT